MHRAQVKARGHGLIALRSNSIPNAHRIIETPSRNENRPNWIKGYFRKAEVLRAQRKWREALAQYQLALQKVCHTGLVPFYLVFQAGLATAICTCYP